jgi:hypothetical protein
MSGYDEKDYPATVGHLGIVSNGIHSKLQTIQTLLSAILVGVALLVTKLVFGIEPLFWLR